MTTPRSERRVQRLFGRVCGEDLQDIRRSDACQRVVRTVRGMTPSGPAHHPLLP